MEARRTCLLCRTSDVQRNLVPLRWEGDVPRIERGAGRGSWFHLACLGAHPRNLLRLTRGQPLDVLRAPLDAWLEVQVLAQLAAVRRLGGIALGRMAVSSQGMVVLASDRCAPRWCDPGATVLLPLSARALGSALGVGPRRAIGVLGASQSTASLLSLARAWQSISSARAAVSGR
jgi:hypothetical protein